MPGIGIAPARLLKKLGQVGYSYSRMINIIHLQHKDDVMSSSMLSRLLTLLGAAPEEQKREPDNSE
jgi:hypothetical protein